MKASRYGCRTPAYRGLVAMGVAAVGGSPVAAFSQADAAHYAPFAAEAAGKPPTGKKTAPFRSAALNHPEP